MRAALKHACNACPFRSDVPGFLGTGARRIIDGLLADDRTSFPCHKTCDYSRVDEDGIPHVPDTAQSCLGALLLLYRIRQLPVAFRFAALHGLIDLPALAKNNPNTFSTVEAFLAHHGDE